MSALYQLEHLVQCYGPRTVLRIDALTLEAGRIYGLLGPNGSGKTTLLKRLAFLEAPTQGRIMFQGQEVTAHNMARLRAKVVWVPQWPVMFSGTLQYNVEYPMRLKKVPKDVRQEKAEALMQAVGIAHLAQSPAQHLSGGEAQRASIARAMAAGAEVILFDEPTANVDYDARADLVALMRELCHQRGLTLIITSHDPDLIATLCDETVTLKNGQAVRAKSSV